MSCTASSAFASDPISSTSMRIRPPSPTACSSTSSPATKAGPSCLRSCASPRPAFICGGRSGRSGAGSAAGRRLGRALAAAILVLPLALGLDRLFARPCQIPAVAARAGSVRHRPRFRLALRGRVAAGRSGRPRPGLAGGMAGGQRRPRLALPGSATPLHTGARPIPSAPRPEDRWNIIIVQLESVAGSTPAISAPTAGRRRRPISTRWRPGPTPRSGPAA